MSPRYREILEPAPPAEVALLMLQAYGLTEREVQVAQLGLQGLATAEIGDRLAITALTVQQHLKAVFDKTGRAAGASSSPRSSPSTTCHVWPPDREGPA